MKVEKLVPEIYYKQSRDFAYIGRLLEILFNYMKSGAECVLIPMDSKTVNANTVQLLVNTLGFESKHEYVIKDLIYIASSFCDLLRNKGTRYSIDTAIRLLLNSQGIKKYNSKQFVEENGSDLNIKIPDSLIDLVLLEDIFDYILPVGTTYKFLRVGAKDNILDTAIFNTEKNSFKANNADLASYIKSATEIGNLEVIDNYISGLGSIYVGGVYSNHNIEKSSQDQKNSLPKSKVSSAIKVSNSAKLNDNKKDIGEK